MTTPNYVQDNVSFLKQLNFETLVANAFATSEGASLHRVFTLKVNYNTGKFLEADIKMFYIEDDPCFTVHLKHISSLNKPSFKIELIPFIPQINQSVSMSVKDVIARSVRQFNSEQGV